MFWCITVMANKTAFASRFVGIIGQIIDIKAHKLLIFIIGQVGKTALVRQIAQIALQHHAQNRHNQGEYAQSG